MKRFAFLVLVFSVAVIAEDKDSLEYEYKLVMNCLQETDMTAEEMQFVQENLMKMQDDNKTENLLKKYGYFAACVEEGMGMIKDSNLVIDKIMGHLVKNMDKYPINKDFVKECLNALDDDSEMTREEKATGVMRCILTGNTDKNQKK